MKSSNRPPATGVDPHGGDAHPVGQVDLVERLLDIGAAQVGVGVDEALVGGEAHQRQAEGVGAALDVLERRVRLVPHLDVEHFDAVKAHVGRPVDAGLDAESLAAELPERVGRDADRLATRPALRGRVRSFGTLLLARGCPGQPDRRGRPGEPGADEELSPIRPHVPTPRFDGRMSRVPVSPDPFSRTGLSRPEWAT
jgi:hypothetical protein